MQVTFQDCSYFTENEIYTEAGTLLPYMKELAAASASKNYTQPENALSLPFDKEMIARVKNEIDKHVDKSLKYIFVVGIGGSNLSAKAVIEALPDSQKTPKMVWLDNLSDGNISICLNNVIPDIKKPSEYLFFSISKSGQTTETLANTEILLEALNVAKLKPATRLVVISDTNSQFERHARTNGVATLAIPPVVGGRFSAFSAAGLAVMYAAGVDIDNLCLGATDITPYGFIEDTKHNPAASSAASKFLAIKSGLKVYDQFIFHPELESVGKWYRQLLAESIGKRFSVDGAEIFTGLVPTVSIGPTDLHSVAQLYLGGPKTVFTAFITSSECKTHKVPNERLFGHLVPMINGRTLSEIREAVVTGTKIAYKDADRPFITIELKDTTPYEIGALMQYQMMEVMFLGKLLNINPFDQPSVESYKKATKKALA